MATITVTAGLLLLVGRADEAEPDIETALQENGNNIDAISLKAIIAIVRNDKARALDLANQAVNIDDKSASARIALSYALQANFKIEEALKAARQGTERDVNNALAWARVAELELSIPNYDKSKQAAEQAVKLNLNLARTQSVLGFANLTRIDIKAAKENFNKAIELNQADPLPRLGIGLAKIREGNLAGGREDIEIAAALDPKNSLVRSYLRKTYYEEKRDELAGRQFDLAKEQDPKDPTPKNSLPRPADVICICQATFEDFPDSIIDQLTNEGRNGNGTAIICAAGNTGKQVSGIGSNSNVITVGNTFPSKDCIEVRDKRSCIGPGLDLCAQGEEVMSVTLQPSRIARFAQTSAAAPIVAATAALMLSVNPQLTSKEVRGILRASATKQGLIDSEIPDIDKDPKKFAQRFGFGPIDVLDAVRTAHRTLPKRSASSKKLVKRVSDKTKGPV